MAELIGGGGYDDVQSTAPTSPSIGDTWLDTSTDPPIGKVYADLGSGGQWTTDLLDAQISSRSSHDDPDPNGYIDQPISNVGGIDFSSKSTHSTYSHVTGGIVQSVSGSGYLLDVVQGVSSSSGTVDLDIDGFHFFQTDATDKNGHVVTGPLRFNSSFTVEETSNPNDADFLIIWVED